MTQAPPETFLEQVKDVLEHLYDFPFLNRHPLAQSTRAGQPSEPAGHRLRRELVAAIEALNPGSGSGARSTMTRVYNLLHLHYVGDMPLPEAASDLGISVRQAYRDLRQGQESVGDMLWFNRQTQAPPEVERIDSQLAVTQINTLLEAAVKAVQRLAEQQNLQMQASIPAEPIILSTHQAAAQQILVHLLSQTIKQSQAGNLSITLKPLPDSAELELTYPPREAQVNDLPITPVIQDFMGQLRFVLTHERTDGGAVVRLLMPAHRSTLLLIDDNQGLIDLLQRYLTGQSFKVLAALNGADGLRLAEEIQPNAIIMDLMMPGMDGWEVLQRLRTAPRTAAIPVIICSVINDPELAYSLGASLFIAKPVTQERILEALQTIGL